MSRFFSERFAQLSPYVPGEQPQDMRYVKLNTNESPFPPPQAVLDAVRGESGRLQLYSDPDGRLLRRKLAESCGVRPEQILLGNGSDEILYLAFMAFADDTHPIAFPDISYGFYPVLASLLNLPCERIPLREDFSIAAEDYCGIGKTVVIANPNAPTGLCLSLAEIERIARTNPATPGTWWSSTRPMWTSAPRAACPSSENTTTCWWCRPSPNPAPWRGRGWALPRAARR